MSSINNKISNFPISFFSVILGMSGITIAYQRAEQILHLPFAISPYLLGLTIILFGLISLIYFYKIIVDFKSVKSEFNHPIKLSFFPTFAISFILLSIGLMQINPSISKYLWLIGTILQFIFTFTIISIWVQHTKFEIKHKNPAWFIPAVGNLIVPISGINYFHIDISFYFFSVGFLFWIILLTIFFNRIIFHQPLADKILPTLFILIAPPAIAFISYVKLTGELDNFAKILYFIGLFFLILVFAQIKLLKNIKFYLSWWAYSFPLAAITIATILMYHETSIEFYAILAKIVLLILSILVTFLIFRTVYAISKNEICIEEE